MNNRIVNVLSKTDIYHTLDITHLIQGSIYQMKWYLDIYKNVFHQFAAFVDRINAFAIESSNRINF